MSTRWAVRRLAGDAGTLHRREPTAPVDAVVELCVVERPALVLGSTQQPGIVDDAAAQRSGVQVVQRRSGGGAVLLWPGEHVWIDVVMPAHRRGWSDDVTATSRLVGRAWQHVLEDLGLGGGLSLHEAGLDHGSMGRLVCFAGRGPGEVLRRDAKLVGIAQRRTRAWARVQCLVHRQVRTIEHVALLGPGVAPDALVAAVACLPSTAPGDDELARALARRLDVDVPV